MTWLLAILILCAVAVVLNHTRRAHGGRPLAELLVDALYRRAMRAAATAVAADRALVAYRAELAEMRDSHTPKYAEAAR